MSYPHDDICGLILAGGRATRMQGQDKGLVGLNHRPMVAYVLDALEPQVGGIAINANRNLERYRAFGSPVISDTLTGFQGPLAGMAAALAHCQTPYIVTVPCDGPLLPMDLVARLYAALQRQHAEISVAHDGKRMQPVFALIHRSLHASLLSYLEAGERKIDRWYERHRTTTTDFSDVPQAFLNVNTPQERIALENELKARQSG